MKGHAQAAFERIWQSERSEFVMIDVEEPREDDACFQRTQWTAPLSIRLENTWRARVRSES